MVSSRQNSQEFDIEEVHSHRGVIHVRCSSSSESPSPQKSASMEGVLPDEDVGTVQRDKKSHEHVGVGAGPVLDQESGEQSEKIEKESDQQSCQGIKPSTSCQEVEDIHEPSIEKQESDDVPEISDDAATVPKDQMSSERVGVGAGPILDQDSTGQSAKIEKESDQESCPEIQSTKNVGVEIRGSSSERNQESDEPEIGHDEACQDELLKENDIEPEHEIPKESPELETNEIEHEPSQAVEVENEIEENVSNTGKDDAGSVVESSADAQSEATQGHALECLEYQLSERSNNPSDILVNDNFEVTVGETGDSSKSEVLEFLRDDQPPEENIDLNVVFKQNSADSRETKVRNKNFQLLPSVVTNCVKLYQPFGQLAVKVKTTPEFQHLFERFRNGAKIDVPELFDLVSFGQSLAEKMVEGIETVDGTKSILRMQLTICSQWISPVGKLRQHLQMAEIDLQKAKNLSSTHFTLMQSGNACISHASKSKKKNKFGISIMPRKSFNPEVWKKLAMKMDAWREEMDELKAEISLFVDDLEGRRRHFLALQKEWKLLTLLGAEDPLSSLLILARLFCHRCFIASSEERLKDKLSIHIDQRVALELQKHSLSVLLELFPEQNIMSRKALEDACDITLKTIDKTIRKLVSANKGEETCSVQEVNDCIQEVMVLEESLIQLVHDTRGPYSCSLDTDIEDEGCPVQVLDRCYYNVLALFAESAAFASVEKCFDKRNGVGGGRKVTDHVRSVSLMASGHEELASDAFSLLHRCRRLQKQISSGGFGQERDAQNAALAREFVVQASWWLEKARVVRVQVLRQAMVVADKFWVRTMCTPSSSSQEIDEFREELLWVLRLCINACVSHAPPPDSKTVTQLLKKYLSFARYFSGWGDGQLHTALKNCWDSWEQPTLQTYLRVTCTAKLLRDLHERLVSETTCAPMAAFISSIPSLLYPTRLPDVTDELQAVQYQTCCMKIENSSGETTPSKNTIVQIIN